MEEIYANVEYEKPEVSSRPSRTHPGPRSSESRSHGAAVLSLGLLSVFLLAGLIGLGVHYHNSVGGSAADLSTIKANLTERLRASEDKLSSVSEERDLLNASLTHLTQEMDRRQRLTNNLTQEMDRRQRLTNNLIQEMDRRQRLTNNLIQEMDRRQRLTNNLTQEMDRRQRWCNQKKTCPEGWSRFHSSCYLLSNKSGSWEESRKDCRDKGADLVIIDSLQEQEFLSSIVTHHTWIGLSDRDDEGTWKWVDGTPLTEAYWGLGEPDNGGGDPRLSEEDCAEIVARNPEINWNDNSCDASRYWICENLA